MPLPLLPHPPPPPRPVSAAVGLPSPMPPRTTLAGPGALTRPKLVTLVPSSAARRTSFFERLDQGGLELCSNLVYQRGLREVKEVAHRC